MNTKFKNIFITGGAGYCGSLLVPQLLESGYRVTVYDTLFFGDDFLPRNNTNLNIIKGDIRNSQKLKDSCQGHDAFISLACISNDASFELDENLSTSINLHAFEPMVKAAKDNGIKRFIYASSSSVYGVSDQKDVKEDHPLVPLTLYNKYKGMCEPILQKYCDNTFTGVIFRPATVCGYGPRLRLDLSVNILTNHALVNNKITVFGGDQLRPNLHIKDYCDVVELLLCCEKEKIQKEVFNVGNQNMSISDIALLVRKIVQEEFPDRGKISIETSPTDDIRSYHINSDKIYNSLGFKPQSSIEDAIRSLCIAYREGRISNSMEKDIFYNIRTMKKLNIK
ncbi:MAG: UDP-glucose 4-epimerase [Alphaproteobacteria bacterium TMED87]|nr:UDP-glucose 4-epimerase [Rhodospirillaceae bacterium]OUV11701.1 MAG: UDP-glucose 4-epimerase [Alphaproteobacteria bacterium TMED87]